MHKMLFGALLGAAAASLLGCATDAATSDAGQSKQQAGNNHRAWQNVQALVEKLNADGSAQETIGARADTAAVQHNAFVADRTINCTWQAGLFKLRLQSLDEASASCNRHTEEMSPAGDRAALLATIDRMAQELRGKPGQGAGIPSYDCGGTQRELREIKDLMAKTSERCRNMPGRVNPRNTECVDGALEIARRTRALRVTEQLCFYAGELTATDLGLASPTEKACAAEDDSSFNAEFNRLLKMCTAPNATEKSCTNHNHKLLDLARARRFRHVSCALMYPPAGGLSLLELPALPSNMAK